MKPVLFTVLFLIMSWGVWAQTEAEIRAKNDVYLYGEGSASTLAKADQYALAMLISQISTQVESKFTQNTDWGTGKELNETVSLVMSTFSTATLNNTLRIVLGNEPDAKVLRYIKRDDVSKVFEQRKNKIIEFVKSAQQAEQNLQISDALRYYYWGLTLLKSHPNSADIFLEANGEKNFLITWIPIQMDAIFASLQLTRGKIIGNTVNLAILYKNKPVSNFDYSFWDGKDWTNLYTAKDGRGFVEFTTSLPDAQQSIKIKAEYIFEGTARIDKELEQVMQHIAPVPFRNSYFELRSDISANLQDNAQAAIIDSPVDLNTSVTSEITSAPYTAVVDKIIKATKSKNLISVQSLFTPEGFEMFQKLVGYGNGQVIGKQTIKVLKSNDKVMYRSVPMSFAFNNNKRKFVEDVVFIMNDQMLVESLTFGLGKRALEDIAAKKDWNEGDRMQIINFLEQYKTAYALKRLDYLESIFADDALIIVGSLVKPKQVENNLFTNNPIVRYNRMSKTQYFKNLKYSFQSNEFININFEDNTIRRSGRGKNIYGIQIRQNYFSQNYGDVGYLFLLVDLTDPKLPIIHVRTWQPEKNADNSIYGVEDF